MFFSIAVLYLNRFNQSLILWNFCKVTLNGYCRANQGQPLRDDLNLRSKFSWCSFCKFASYQYVTLGKFAAKLSNPPPMSSREFLGISQNRFFSKQFWTIAFFKLQFIKNFHVYLYQYQYLREKSIKVDTTW